LTIWLFAGIINIRIGNEMTPEQRKLKINLNLSEFKIPPMPRALVIGSKSPIGVGAARKMANATSSEEYEVIPIKDNIIEAIVIEKSAFKTIARKVLIPTIVEESEKIMTNRNIIKIDFDITVVIKRIIDLTEKAELQGRTTLKELSKGAKERAEKEMIIQALEKANWNKAQVARQLGIDYKTLYYKINDYGIKKPKS